MGLVAAAGRLAVPAGRARSARRVAAAAPRPRRSARCRGCGWCWRRRGCCACSRLFMVGLCRVCYRAWCCGRAPICTTCMASTRSSAAMCCSAWPSRRRSAASSSAPWTASSTRASGWSSAPASLALSAAHARSRSRRCLCRLPSACLLVLSASSAYGSVLLAHIRSHLSRPSGRSRRHHRQHGAAARRRAAADRSPGFIPPLFPSQGSGYSLLAYQWIFATLAVCLALGLAVYLTAKDAKPAPRREPATPSRADGQGARSKPNLAGSPARPASHFPRGSAAHWAQ